MRDTLTDFDLCAYMYVQKPDGLVTAAALELGEPEVSNIMMTMLLRCVSQQANISCTFVG